MTTRIRDLAAVLVCGLALADRAMAAPSAAAPARPNIIVILADDLGAGELGCYGNAVHRTPNLDRLAAGGVRFRTCWATPLCSPSRVLLMTGQYGFRTGWFDLHGRENVPPPGDTVSPDLTTFADVLKARGYATGMAGKWQLGPIDKHPRTILSSGFDAYRAWACQAMPKDAPDGLGPRAERRRYWWPSMIQNGSYLPTDKNDYGPDLECEWLMNFMEKQKDGPFLLYWPMTLTHEPWDPTPDSSVGDLRSSVEYMDKLVGRLAAKVEKLGLKDRTVILYTGDNGTGRSGKGQRTEKGVRTPLIVNGAGVRRGFVSDALVDFSDFLPTVADLAGADLPNGVTLDGKSFAPVLHGRSDGERNWIFSYLAYERMLRDRRWLLDGAGRLWDTGGRRDGEGYVEVTGSQASEVVEARRRFAELLERLPAAQKREGNPKLGRAARDGAAVRGNPTTASAVVKRLKKGTELRITLVRGDWRKVVSPVQGWMHSSEVDPGVLRVVEADFVEVRVGPGTGYDAVRHGTLDRGTKLKVRAMGAGDWRLINEPVNGWVNAQKIAKR